MLAALRGLAANLAAGARLALFLPVGRTAFRLDAAQLVFLAFVSALVEIGADWLRIGPEGSLDLTALAGELTGFAMLLFIAALLAWVLREGSLLLALPVVVLASLPLVQLSSVLPTLLEGDPERAAWVLVTVRVALLAWYVLVLARSAHVALVPHALRWLRALGAGALLAAPLLVPPGLLPDASWWSIDEPAAMDPTNAAAEPILSLQRELQDEALASLEEHTQDETDLYFVGFAPDGASEVWRERMEAAQRVMDERWGTQGHSIVYVNDATRLTEAPIASVTHLREVFEEIAAASDPNEDVVMLYLAGRSNADGSMTVRLPPLGLVQLSGPGLASLLEQAGLRWRVVVVATCAPQPFLDALADAHTLVIAAAGGSDRPEGCGRGGEPTVFGDVLFGESLAASSTLPAAFAAAHRKLAERGVAPVIHVGDAIGTQLARLRSAPGGRAGIHRGRSRG